MVLKNPSTAIGFRSTRCLFQQHLTLMRLRKGPFLIGAGSTIKIAEKWRDQAVETVSRNDFLKGCQ
jgi:hypothetical protein